MYTGSTLKTEHYAVSTFSGKRPTQAQNSPVHPVSKDDV